MDEKENPYLERIDVSNEISGISHFERVFDYFESHGIKSPKRRYNPAITVYVMANNTSEMDNMSFAEHARKTRLSSSKYGLDSLSLENKRVNYDKSGGSSVTSRFEMCGYTLESVIDEWVNVDASDEQTGFDDLVQLVMIHDHTSKEYAQELTVLNIAILLQGAIVESQIAENTQNYVLAGESADIGGIDLYKLVDGGRENVQVKSWKDGYNNEHDIDYHELCWAWFGGELMLSNCPYHLANILSDDNHAKFKLNNMHKYLTFRMHDNL
jgi:hypothetical protein